MRVSDNMTKRDELEKLAWDATYDVDECDVIIAAADAMALEAHVEICLTWSSMKSPYERDGHRKCGDGWFLCKIAERLRE